MSPRATSALGSPASAAPTKKARAVAMSPWARATRPSAQRRRASSIGIASAALGPPACCSRSAVGCSRSAVASLPIASLLNGCAVAFSADAAASEATKTGCSTAAFTFIADGSRRGQHATTRTQANAPATRPATAFHEMASVRSPLLHQPAPARQAIVEPIRIRGARASRRIRDGLGRGAEGVERRVG